MSTWQARDWMILPGTSQATLHRVDHGMADRLVAEACQRLGVKRETLMMRNRRRKLAWERQDIMRALRVRFGWSYPRIAGYFGIHHTSVMHGVTASTDRHARRRCAVNDECVEFLHDMVKLEGAQLMESA